MSDYQSHGGGGGSSMVTNVVLGVVGLLAFTSLIVGSVALTRVNNINNSAPVTPPPVAPPVPPQPSCDPTGVFKCIANSYCVGIQGFPQNSSSYYTSASNGIEFDQITYLPSPPGAPLNYFMHMQIHGGCANKPCGFNENELYTQVPGTTLNYEGFTVNRTGADLGEQVFYENLYFSTDCSNYTKIVKGQQVGTPLTPAAVLCRNICQRTTQADYELGIQGGYTP